MFEPHHSKHFEKTVETLCVYYSLVDNEPSLNNSHHGNATISDDCRTVAVGIGTVLYVTRLVIWKTLFKFKLVEF